MTWLGALKTCDSSESETAHVSEVNEFHTQENTKGLKFTWRWYLPDLLFRIPLSDEQCGGLGA